MGGGGGVAGDRGEWRGKSVPRHRGGKRKTNNCQALLVPKLVVPHRSPLVWVGGSWWGGRGEA